METKKMEILPLVGLDNLEFGLSTDEVSALIGGPNETEVIEADDDDDIETLLWYYDETGFTFFFEGIDTKILNCIETDNEDCLLFGNKIFELNEAEIIKLMNDNGFKEVETEDEEWGERRVSFEEVLIDFYFENDALNSVSWGVFDQEEDDE